MLDAPEYIVSYGSLLSHDSRLRFSDIDGEVLPVKLHGWQRQWITQNEQEGQTHVGATPAEGSSLNAALVPTVEITDKLRLREQHYDFAPVSLSQLQFYLPEKTLQQTLEALTNKRLWICQSKQQNWPQPHVPIMQTYVDTCIQGCLETGIEGFAREFIEQTKGWEHAWLNDRQSPRYPRAAKTTKYQRQEIDELLELSGALSFRTEKA